MGTNGKNGRTCPHCGKELPTKAFTGRAAEWYRKGRPYVDALTQAARAANPPGPEELAAIEVYERVKLAFDDARAQRDRLLRKVAAAERVESVRRTPEQKALLKDAEKLSAEAQRQQDEAAERYRSAAGVVNRLLMARSLRVAAWKAAKEREQLEALQAREAKKAEPELRRIRDRLVEVLAVGGKRGR